MLIGLDESSSRARISRYELGNHEPQLELRATLRRRWGYARPPVNVLQKPQQTWAQEPCFRAR